MKRYLPLLIMPVLVLLLGATTYRSYRVGVQNIRYGDDKLPQTMISGAVRYVDGVTPINVLAFGVDNSGASVCRDSLQSVLTLAGQDSLSVYIPQGEYDCGGGNLSVPAGVCLFIDYSAIVSDVDTMFVDGIVYTYSAQSMNDSTVVYGNGQVTPVSSLRVARMGESGGSTRLGAGFYPYVINGLSTTLPPSGRTLTFAGGSAVINGVYVEADTTDVYMPVGQQVDVYLGSGGNFFTRTAAIYTEAVSLPDSCWVASAGVSESSIISVHDRRQTRMIAKRVPGSSWDPAEYINSFWIPDTCSAWVDSTYYGWGSNVISDGNIYQMWAPYTQDHAAQSSADGAPTGLSGPGWINHPDFGNVFADTSTFVDDLGDTVTTAMFWGFVAPESHAGSLRYATGNGELWVFSANFLKEACNEFGQDKTRTALEYMTKRIILPWEAETAIFAGALRFNGVGIYECVTGGTTSAASPPTGTGLAIVDGDVEWNYYCPHHGVYPAWSPETEYSLGDQVQSSGQAYYAENGGTSGVSGPSGRGDTGTISDGDITWSWMSSLYAQRPRPVTPVEGLNGQLEFGWHASDSTSVWGGSSHYWKDTYGDFTPRMEDSQGSYVAEWIDAWFNYFKLSGRYDLLDSVTVHGPTLFEMMKDASWNCILRDQVFYPTWSANTEYMYDDQIIVGRYGETRIVRCIDAGTSDGEQPVWPVEYPETVTDGTVVWQAGSPGGAWGLALGLGRGLLPSYPGGVFRIGYLMDNCEHYNALRLLTEYMVTVGDADADYYVWAIDKMAKGVGTLYDNSVGAFRYADESSIADIDSSFYPWGMAQYHPEYYQIPLDDNPARTAEMYRRAWEYVNNANPQWWERNTSGFPWSMAALNAARWREETYKAQSFLDSWQNYMSAGPRMALVTISDVGWIIGLKRILGGAGESDQYPTELFAGSRLVLGDGGTPVADRPFITYGVGSPEGAVPAPPGSLFLRIDGEAATSVYIKTGTGLTGWSAR
jgi:hypothetical protein